MATAVAFRAVLARNATVVARSGTLHVRVPMVLPTLGMVAEATVLLAVEVKLGAASPFHTSTRFEFDAFFFFFFSYTCGGVGHLSRDCVQGSKCYNCSGIVCIALGDADWVD